MRNTVFMVMPFSDSVAESVYRHCTKPLLETMGFEVFRADEIFSANPILEDVVSATNQATLVLVDISGANPNCFYELGVAHTLKPRRTIVITHDNYNDAPFDIAHFRILQYEDSIAGKGRFEKELRSTAESVTADLSELYESEFELVRTMAEATDTEDTLMALVAATKLSRPGRPEDSLEVEWHRSGGVHGMFRLDSEKYTALQRMGYIDLHVEGYSVNKKGSTFAHSLEEKGFVIVDAVGGDVFSDDYLSYMDRLKARVQAAKEQSVDKKIV